MELCKKIRILVSIAGFLWHGFSAAKALEKNSLPLTILREFSDCHVDLIQGDFQNAVGDFSQDEEYYFPVTRLSGELGKVMTTFRELFELRRQTCELILGAHDIGEERMRQVLQHYDYMINCDSDHHIHNYKHSQCYSEYVYTIMTYPIENLLFKFPVYEITIDGNAQNLRVRVIGYTWSELCFFVIKARLNFSSAAPSVRQHIHLRRFIKESMSLLFNTCPWIASSAVHGVSVSNGSIILPGGGRKILNAPTIGIDTFLHGVLQTQGNSMDFIRKYHIQIYKSPVKGRELESKFALIAAGTLYASSQIYAKKYSFYESTVSFNFITCHPSSKYISFTMYIRPYSIGAWLSIFLTFLVSIYVISVQLERKDFSRKALYISTRIVLEQGITFRSSGIKKNTITYFVFALLLITWFIITNAYKGKVVTAFTAPLPSYQMEKIVEAVGKDYKVLLLYPEGFVENLQWRYSEYHRNVITDQQHLSINNLFLSALWTYVNTRNFTEELSLFIFRLMNQTLYVDDYRNRTAFVEAKFQECGKTILIGDNFELNEFRKTVKDKFGKKKWSNVYYGKDKYLLTNNYWKLGPVNWDKGNIVGCRVQSFVHSGILPRLTRRLHGENQLVTEEFQIRPMSLSSNGVSIFCIFGALVGLAILIFPAELQFNQIYFVLSVICSFFRNNIRVRYYSFGVHRKS